MVFGTKRDNKPDSELREDVVGSLYPDSFPNEDDMAQNSMEYRRGDPGNESVIDPHARFNGKYVSDRDLRIEGEANGEIECSGTLIISPQAKVRSMITAANVIIKVPLTPDGLKACRIFRAEGTKVNVSKPPER